MLSAIIVVVALLLAGYLALSRRLAASSNWKATVTPLASIMGSGFLVSAPLLAGVVGNMALVCMAGRANFITGELPIRTGMTTVGQAGAKIGMPDQAPTIATALRSMGYATGQFGKSHLGDLNPFLPTLHGFDEFFGYLYHLDAVKKQIAAAQAAHAQ